MKNEQFIIDQCKASIANAQIQIVVELMRIAFVVCAQSYILNNPSTLGNFSRVRSLFYQYPNIYFVLTMIVVSIIEFKAIVSILLNIREIRVNNEILKTFEYKNKQ